MGKILLTVPQETHDELRLMKIDKGMTITNLINLYIEEGLNNESTQSQELQEGSKELNTGTTDQD